MKFDGLFEAIAKYREAQVEEHRFANGNIYDPHNYEKQHIELLRKEATESLELELEKLFKYFLTRLA